MLAVKGGKGLKGLERRQQLHVGQLENLNLNLQGKLVGRQVLGQVKARAAGRARPAMHALWSRLLCQWPPGLLSPAVRR